MKRLFRHFVHYLPSIITIIVLFLAVIQIKPASAIAGYPFSWKDEFASTTLNPFWSWVREVPSHWSLTASSGKMRIITQPGTFMGPSSNNQKNLLLLQAPDGDFELITKVSIDPSANFQHAALIVYQDDDNYVEINRSFTGGDAIHFDIETGGAISTTAGVSNSATTLCLRITRTATLYGGFYSTDSSCSTGWTPVGSGPAAFTTPKVGLGASNGPSTTEINADFEFFQISSAASIFDYYWVDEFDQNDNSLLHPLWSWMREDPTHWSLSAVYDYLRVTTQPGAIYGADNSQQNILLTKVPDTDYQITTRVTINPTEEYQAAELIVYEDDDNYVQLSRYHDGTNNVVGFGVEIDSTPSTGAQIIESATTIYLRITRIGDTYTGYYSTNSTTWVLVDSATVELSAPRVGLDASNGPSTIEINADFAYFKLEGNFPNYSNASTDEFEDTTLDPKWSWINEDPSGWSLDDYPGSLFIRTTAQEVGGKNLLVQKIPSFDFWIETQVDFLPVNNYQFAGLILYDGSEDYMAFGREYCGDPGCAGNGIYFNHKEGGTPVGNRFGTATAETDTATLRVLREGPTYFGFYRSESSKWLLIGRHAWGAPVDLTSIGITAAQGFFSNADATFDYFQVTPGFLSYYIPLVRSQ
jgi:beta-xylosidase